MSDSDFTPIEVRKLKVFAAELPDPDQVGAITPAPKSIPVHVPTAGSVGVSLADIDDVFAGRSTEQALYKALFRAGYSSKAERKRIVGAWRITGGR